MPWERKTVMEQREAFVEAVLRREKSVTSLCQEFGISRKTGYKWLNRAALGQQLSDESRCPHRQPSKTAGDIEAMILTVRAAYPSWGGKSIRAALEAAGVKGLPSVKTCSNILKRNGCIDPEESKKRIPCQRFEREKCNELWQMDFKGDFLLGDGTRCYPLDILDDHSRFCLCCEPKDTLSGVKEHFVRILQEYGMPDALLTDNGAQFAGFRGGYTELERMLMDLDIAPIHGRIMHPQTQGKIERFHRTMNAEALRTKPETLAQAKQRLENWRWRYNNIRPHAALDMKTPASVYCPSARPYHTPEPYVYDEGARLVKINNWGYLRFGPIQVYLSETMRDTYLEIRPYDEDAFAVIYRNYRIAIVDANLQKLRNRVIKRL